MSAELATVSFRTESGVTEDASWTVVDSVVLSKTVPWRTFRWYKGQRHYSGAYWSATMRDHVTYESRLELARLIFADFDAWHPPLNLLGDLDLPGPDPQEPPCCRGPYCAGRSPGIRTRVIARRALVHGHAICKSRLELARVIFAGSGQAVPPRLQREARLR
jgi:hypothetical protein